MVGFDLGDQSIGRRGAQRLGHKLHVERQHIARLCIAALALSFGIIDRSKG